MEQVIRDRMKAGVSRATINYELKTFNKIDRLATEEWRRKGGKPFLGPFTRAYLIKRRGKMGW